jgi:outer membrane PBP1 activator LpoA protein
MHNNFVQVLSALSLSVLLAACAPQTQQPQDNKGALEQQALAREVSALVDKARHSNPRERHHHLLQAAHTLLQQGEPEWAYSLLQPLATANMSDATYLEYLQRYSAAAYQSDHFFAARDALNSARLQRLWPTLKRPQQRTLLERRAQTSSLLGDYQNSLNARIELGRLLGRDQLYPNNEAIWQDLMSLSTPELAALTGDSDTLSAWAELAQVARASAANLNRQLERVEQWRLQHPGHPANLELPSDLQLLRQLIAQQPNNIALLLPQSGRLAGAANAVRDGFLAAYFAERSAGQSPVIKQYDTSAGDINSLYEQAVSEGAELVIGPLAKAGVEALAQRPQLRVPVLALNYREAPNEASVPLDLNTLKLPPTQANLPDAIALSASRAALATPASASEADALFAPKLYQFGLAAEDEARQIARHAHLQGHRRAMIIAPDIDWAERSVEAFINQWRQLDGEVVALSRYVGAGDYSKVLKRSLLVDDSEQRHDQLRKIIYTNSHFEPRRRQDVEMIFLIANPPQARQIKPTLAFHYAGDIPVFATSQIYAGSDNPKADRDLNGVRFSTLPWLFADNLETRSVSAHTDAPPAYQRLHAMGADAYHLYPRLPQLNHLPQTRVLGATGTLSMQQDGRIVREQIWATFNNGIAQPITRSAIDRADHNL